MGLVDSGGRPGFSWGLPGCLSFLWGWYNILFAQGFRFGGWVRLLVCGGYCGGGVFGCLVGCLVYLFVVFRRCAFLFWVCCVTACFLAVWYSLRGLGILCEF